MLLGQLLDGKPNATATYFSPWFPRGGNLAKFTCQVFASESLSGGGEGFKISVETKNSEDSDKDQSAFTPQGGGAQTMTLTALALTTWEVGADLGSSNNGFLELVRFKYQLISATASTEPWVHFRILNPVWLTN
jgi:hypothetical protein